jgi:hypothetical protein
MKNAAGDDRESKREKGKSGATNHPLQITHLQSAIINHQVPITNRK